MKKNAQQIYEKCDVKGIRLWTEGGKLRFKAPKGTFTEELKEEVKASREELISYIKELESVEISSHPENQNELFLLTEVQSSYLIGRESIYEYGGIGCHAYVEVKLPRCDGGRMERAWHKVIGKHDMLQAVVMKDGYQKVVEDFVYPALTERVVQENLMETVLEVRKELSQKKYDCSEPPLYDLAMTSNNDTSIIHFSMDMLLADSVSMGIILNDLLEYYNDENKEAQKTEISFRDVLLYDETYKSRPTQKLKRDEDRLYWMQRMDSLPDAPHLPLKAEPDKFGEPEFEQYEFLLEQRNWKAFSDYATAHQITPSAAVMMAFVDCLSMWSGNQHFSLNVTTMLRPAYHKDINRIVGDFTSNDILEVNRAGSESFAVKTAEVQKQLWQDMEHNAFSGIEVIRELNRRKKYRVLMPYVYTSTLGMEGLENDAVNVIYKTSQTPQVFIDCQVSENQGQLSVVWSVRKGVLEDAVAATMFEWMKNILLALSASSDNWESSEVIEIPSPDKDFYEAMQKKVHTEEKKWKLQYEDVDTSCCEEILKNHIEAEDIAVIDGERLDVYVAPKVNEDITERETLEKQIRTLTQKEAEELCTQVDSHTFTGELEIAEELAILDIMRTFRQAGTFLNADRHYTLEELEQVLSVAPQYKNLLRRWLAALLRENFISGDSDGGYYALIMDVEERYTAVTEKIHKMVIDQPGSRGMEDYLLSSGEKLLDSISGKINPVEFLFPKGETERAFAIYHDLFAAKLLNRMALSAIRAIAEKKDTLKILEVGSGVGGTSDDLIPFLKDYQVKFFFTDISKYFLQEARKKYEEYDFVEYLIYDLNKPCYEQGFEPGNFDIIVSANTFHNAVDGYKAMEVMKEALAPDGYIIFLDCIWESNALLTSKGMLHTGEICDSRGDDNRIFFTDAEWRSMFKHADLELVDDYPEQNHFFAKSNLKYYTVRNKIQYRIPEVSNADVWLGNVIPDKEKIGKIVVSQMLPKKTDGSIDKQAITARKQSLAAGAVSVSGQTAENELEEQIVQIWKEVFENEYFADVNANFFELGGDSLLASMVVTKMRSKIKLAEAVEWNDLMNLLLKNNTVRTLAAALQKQTGKAQDIPDYVMVYQEGGEKPEKVWAFFVNGTATMPIYQPLYELLKKRIPETDRVLGFHCGNPKKFVALDKQEVIPVMAERNSRYLLAQNVERYQLIGHCFGGGVAIETARRMKEERDVNVSVATIDTRRWFGNYDNTLFFEKGFGEMYGADMSKCGYTINDALLKQTMVDFEKKYGRLLSEEEMCTHEEVPEEIRSCFNRLRQEPVKERIHRIFLQVEEKLPGGFDEAFFTDTYYMFLKILSAFTEFSPVPYQYPVDVFLCRERNDFLVIRDDVEQIDYGKEAVADGGNRIWIDGDHFTCMEFPNVEKIIDVITGK